MIRFADVKKALNELRGGPRPQPSTPTPKEGKRRLRPDVFLHPGLEVRRDFILFGFREEVIGAADRTETRRARLVAMVADGGGLKIHETNGNTLKVGDHRYVIRSTYDYPPRLNDEWSREGLSDFINDPAALDGRALYTSLREAVHRHLDLDEEGAEILVALYPVISFVFPAFPACPFLLFVGPKETGKSQALDVLSRLCRTGIKTRATAAVVGDLVETQRATILLDQANGLGEELRDLLTDSYRAGTQRTLVNVDQRGQPHSFRIYGPKVFAAHGDFDTDLVDRCVQFPMSPAARRVEPILADDTRLDELRHELYSYTALHFQSLFDTRALRHSSAAGDKYGLSNRSWELFRPFAAVSEWLDIPDGDRKASIEYFRKSWSNTVAELPPESEALLRALGELADGTDDPLEIDSPDLIPKVQSNHDVSDAKVGSMLRDLGLVIRKDRPRLSDGSRITRWTINRSRLERMIKRWGLAEANQT